MFNTLKEDSLWVDTKKPRWVARLIQIGGVVLAAGCVFGLLCLGMLMIE